MVSCVVCEVLVSSKFKTTVVLSGLLEAAFEVVILIVLEIVAVVVVILSVL